LTEFYLSLHENSHARAEIFLNFEPMKNKRRYILLTVAFLLTFLPGMRAADPHAMFYLDTADGLSNNYVRSLCQDAHGYVWVATDMGLNRYDGSHFTTYYKENSGLLSNELNWVLADGQNPDWVWISTQRDGLCRYDYATGTIQSVMQTAGLSCPDIPHLSLSGKGGLWLTLYHLGVDYYNPRTGEVRNYPIKDAQGRNLRSWCSVEDRAGRYLYVGHVDGGLSRVTIATGEVTHYLPNPADPYAIPSSQVFALCMGQDGLLWLGTEGGAASFDPDSERFTAYVHDPRRPSSIQPGDVHSIIQLKSGELWMATSQGGVSILQPAWMNIGEDARFAHLTTQEGALSEAFVRQLMQDSFGNVWMGMYCKGLNVRSYEQPMFTQINPMTSWGGNGQSKESVWSLAFDRKGKLWLAGTDEVVSVDDQGHTVHRWVNPDGPHYNMARTVACDEQDRIWIGTSHSGVYIYDVDADKMHHPLLTPKDVYYIYAEPGDRVWIGTHDGLYSSTDGGLTAQEETLIDQQLTDHIITALLRDADHNLWVGTFGNGVFIFTPQGKLLRNLSLNTGLPGAAVNALYLDSHQRMWVATRTGVKAYERLSSANADDAYAYGTKQGLKNIHVHAFAEDRDGNVWLSSSQGIACVNPGTHAVAFYEYARKQHFDAFNNGAVAQDSTGNIYFGSLGGLTVFNPSQLNRSTPAMDVKVTRVQVYERKSKDEEAVIDFPLQADRLTLTHTQNTFTISYNILDITRSSYVELAYNMQGLDDLWTPARDNIAVFRSLPPGQYNFRVRMRINGQRWSEPITLLHVEVSKPWWATWWALTLSMALLLGVVGVIFWFYYCRLRAEQQLILEEAKNKNQEHLNEEKLRFFTNVTHELRTPLSMILGPLEDLVGDPSLSEAHQGKLRLIRSNSMRLLNLINTILDFRKTETQHHQLAVVEGDFVKFVREIAVRFRELNRNPEVEVRLDIPDEELPMYYDPETIQSVLNNLVGNALKYTPRGTITISVRTLTQEDTRYVDLGVADTGVGISRESLPFVFDRYFQGENSRHVNGTGIGLALTRNLVELHQGTIRVESEEGRGSVFTVRLRVDNLYVNARHLSEANAAGEEGAPVAPVTAEAREALPGEGEQGAVMLVVEDDNDVRTYVAESFQTDFRVLTASNGREGLTLAREHQPDIIVSDIMMPEMDGIEMCRTLKHDLATSHIPVILLTAKDSLADKELGYDVGADSYITKPFSTQLLRARIFNMMEARHKLALRLLSLQEPDTAADTAADNPTTIDATSATADVPAQGTAPEEIISPLDRDLLSKMKQLVAANMEKEDMDMAWLAEQLCMSQSTLYRKIKSVTGVRPNEFVKKIKLQRAAELLLQGTDLGDIPFLTGFSSPAYFRKVFKAEYGVTPTEYIQSHVESKSQSS
jgi:signal transduction histidine kinase/ligand-binding sensor domain-containing protein/DNA-binding response OmpR family regulator